MSADLLRQAATILRERTRCEDCHNSQRYDDALADWLDTAGADFFAWGNAHHDPDHEPCDYCDDDPRAEHLRRALAVARLIVGGAS